MKAYLAGLFHDIARELPPNRLLSLVREYGYPIDQATENAPILAHGAVSAIIAKENYHIIDEEILTAMERHTLGHEDAGQLDRILFLADAIEPNRCYEGVETLRNLARKNLTSAVLQATEQSLQYLQERNLAPHPRTLGMQRRLLQEIKEINEKNK